MPDELIPPSPSQEAYGVEQDQGDVFTHNDPFALFADWLTLATASEPNDPNAMALATADASGAPDVRMVLLKDVSENGLTFHTSRKSAKGRQLSGNGRAALCFHWKTIRRQVRFRGLVGEVSEKEASAYFATRARGARIGAWASNQSEIMEDPQALKRAVAKYEKQFTDENVPRPDYWTGFRLIPLEIEFWVNRPFRLHDRLLFKRKDAVSSWEQKLLYP